jgi:hypothetical protein
MSSGGKNMKIGREKEGNVKDKGRQGKEKGRRGRKREKREVKG